MQEKIDQLKIAVGEELEKVESNKVLYDLKARFMGKNGEITALLRGMKDVPPESRSAFGKLINDLKNEVEEELSLYLMNILNDINSPLAVDTYMDLVLFTDSENLRELATESLYPFADKVATRIIEEFSNLKEDKKHIEKYKCVLYNTHELRNYKSFLQN